ncbi:MAG TPA: hypothetical protein VFA54_09715 [Bryobacterales bacterium]|nr:hypothetical protein [Bryobacterales bacterium]
MPAPGALNYIEGQVYVDGRPLPPGAVRSTVLAPHQVLQTGQGKAELLLTPGVFLRVGDGSEMRMSSAGLADVKVAVIRGSAMLEAAELFKENNLAVSVGEATAKVEKKGLYEFSASQPAIAVLDGKAVVYQDDSHVTVQKNEEVLLEQHPLKARKLDEKTIQADPLYRWSKLRSEYLARANIDTARTVVMYGGWYGPGWYWDPFWGFYSYVPAWGVIYSPFGFAFYAPAWVWNAPIVYYHYPVIAGSYYRRRVPGRGFRSVPRIAHAFHGVPPGGFRAATPRIPPRGIALASGSFRPGGVSGGAGRR